MIKAQPFVFQTTLTTGDGPKVLRDTYGRRGFAEAFPDNDADNLFYYSQYFPPTKEFEEGEGYLDDDGALVAVIVHNSSNNGQKVVWPAGEKLISCDIPSNLQATATTVPQE